MRQQKRRVALAAARMTGLAACIVLLSACEGLTGRFAGSSDTAQEGSAGAAGEISAVQAGDEADAQDGTAGTPGGEADMSGDGADAQGGAVDMPDGEADAQGVIAGTPGEAGGQAGALGEEANAQNAASGVQAASGLEYWTEDSEAAASLTEYVTSAIDAASENYIPAEDRIAVFDLDGTLYGERFPVFYDWKMFIYRVLYDDTYDAPEEIREFALEMEEEMQEGDVPGGTENRYAAYEPQVYRGMTVEKYKEYVRDFLQLPAEGFNGMTYAEAFYKPMLSLVAYLQANDFTVYICSGRERNSVRVQIEGVLDIPAERVIGSDYTIEASGQEDLSGWEYTYQEDDELVFGGALIFNNIRMNKVSAIAREIGRYPVLAFGNSTGDLAMAEYTTQNETYEGRAYLLLCDDTERDYGDPDKAEAFQELCDDAGFHTISMKEDFDTIYGADVSIASPAS